VSGYWATGAGKRLAYRLGSSFSGGAAGLILMWYAAYKAYKGKWPHEDQEARLLQIPLNPEDKAKYPRLFGNDPTKTAYINFAFFSPLVSRGSRALGISGAFEARQLGGTRGQQEEYAQRDIYNSFAHPFVSGPLVRAPFVFLTGREPQLTSLRDTTGRFGPEFFPATIKAAPGVPTIIKRAEEAVLNVNPFAQVSGAALGVGHKGEMKAKEGQPARWMRMITDLVAPRLFGSSVDVVANKERLAKQAKAAGGQPTPDVKLPDDVRLILHKHEVIPHKPNRKPGESDQDYTKRAEAADTEIAARVRAISQDPAFQSLDSKGQQEELKKVMTGARHETGTAPKGETDSEGQLLQERAIEEDRIKLKLQERPEYKGFSDEQQKKAMGEVSRQFEQFGVRAAIQKLPARTRSDFAERQRNVLRQYRQSGVLDKIVDSAILRARAAA
jgi:hypothetical protein